MARISMQSSLFLVGILAFASVGAEDMSIEALIDTAILGEHRSAENKARDTHRHPKETLLFFGVTPNMNILEVLPGSGWYTEILAPVFKDRLTVASFGINHPNDYLRSIHVKYTQLLDKHPEVYQQIKHVRFEQKAGYLGSVADESQDMVVTFRNTHNWIRFGGIEDVYHALHRILKKGGTLGIVQHRADKGSNPKNSAENGYVPESFLINFVEDIGFELVGKSEINANPKDTKNYPEGVWTLPPSYRLEDVNRHIYDAIGESDRMTLKFVKL